MDPSLPTSPLTQAVILAGGRGTRLRPLTDTRPKAMIEFHGKPFLQYLIEMLRDQGVGRILLLLGYLPDVIRDHFGDGHSLGVEIDYAITPPEYETSRRVQLAQSKIDEHFLLLYCDNYWPMRLDHMWAEFAASGVPAQVTVYANRDAYSRSGIKVGPDGMVEAIDRSRIQPGLQGVEISYAILTKSAVMDLLSSRDEPFEAAVYPTLAARRQLHAYWTQHRYYSVGGFDRLKLTEDFLARRPAIILDRDGVLNVRPPRARYVTSPSEFRWIDGALEALRLLHGAGYRIMVVSNQAGIARGEMSPADLEAVHARLLADVAAAGGHVHAIYYCPHGWDDGCDCRKPKPGMLFQAQREHNLDLTRTLFVGDDERDGQAAHLAGCRFMLASEEQPLLDITLKLLDSLVNPAKV